MVSGGGLRRLQLRAKRQRVGITGADAEGAGEQREVIFAGEPEQSSGGEQLVGGGGGRGSRDKGAR